MSLHVYMKYTASVLDSTLNVLASDLFEIISVLHICISSVS